MINRAVICGHLTQKPDILNGVCRFELLFREKFTDKSGLEHVYITCHPCSMFGNQAIAFVSRANIGDLVVLEGRLRNYEHTNRMGVTSKDYRIVTDRFMLIDKNKQSTSKPDYDIIQPSFNDDMI